MPSSRASRFFADFCHRHDYGNDCLPAHVHAGREPEYEHWLATLAWALNPSWSATWIPVSRFELTTRISYLYNLANGNPGGGLTSTREGQAVFDNFAVAFELLPYDSSRTGAHSLRAGLNGYYFKQVTQNAVDGAAQSNSLEQALAIGPGAMWVASNNDIFWLNAYVETMVQNRFASDIVQARYLRMF
jgi:hypothetical protein